MSATSAPIHAEILDVVRRLCRRRGRWTFGVNDVVRALPHRNAATVRTHVSSRCCTNAPKNHPHKWDYFRRVDRGTYELLPAYRKAAAALSRAATRVAEARAVYRMARRAPRDTVHGFVSRDGDWFVAECFEIAVVTQGRTLDETADALREAVALHLEGDDAAALGFTREPRLVLQYEMQVQGGDAET